MAILEDDVIDIVGGNVSGGGGPPTTIGDPGPPPTGLPGPPPDPGTGGRGNQPRMPDAPIYDPNTPIYARPDTRFEQRGIDQNSIDSYIDPSQTMQGLLTGLLQSGNPLLELARAQNARGYNSRGLLNSAGKVAGGTLATMTKAIDITAPDAALYGDMAKMQQKADQDAALNTQVAGYEHNKELLRGDISSALTKQEYEGNVELQKMNNAAQMQRIQLDNQWKRTINFDNLDAQAQQGMLQIAATLGAELTGGIERILRDTNIEDKTAAIAALMDVYQSQMNTAAAIAGLTLTWN